MERGLKWVIDPDAFVHNARVVRSLIGPDVFFFGVLKSDAYGYGLTRVAEFLKSEVNGFATGCVADAKLVRKVADRPVLSYPSPPEFGGEMDGIIPSVWSQTSLEEALRDFNQDVAVKVDVGFGRLGFPPADAPDAISRILAAGRNCRILYTHLSYPAGDPDRTRAEFGIFRDVIERVRGTGAQVPFTMCAGTATVLGYAEMKLEAVNCGHMIYGYPLPATRRDQAGLHQPTASLSAAIIQVRNYAGGERLGYGDGLRLTTDKRVAIAATGYSDGYPVEGQSAGGAIVSGKFAPLLYPPTLEHCALDVTGIPCDVGDEAYFVGGAGDSSIPWHEAAEAAGKTELGLSVSLKPTSIVYQRQSNSRSC